MSTFKGMIPFNQFGDLITYTSCKSTEVGLHDGVTWRENYEFSATMTIAVDPLSG